MTISQYAQHRRIKTGAVYEALSEGVISLLPDGTIDYKLADHQWAERWSPQADLSKALLAEPSGAFAPGLDGDDYSDDGETISYVAERARHERMKANLAELRYLEAAGSVLQLERTNRRIYEIMRSLRSRLLAIPARIAPKLAGETDIHVIHGMLTEALKAALEGAAEEVECMGTDDTEEPPDGEPASDP